MLVKQLNYCNQQVDFVTDHIKRVTESGVELVNGTTVDLDVLVCATGTYQAKFITIHVINDEEHICMNK